MPQIENAKWCKIVGNLSSIVADGPALDEDDYPDVLNLSGIATFSPMVDRSALIADEGATPELDRSYGVADVQVQIIDGQLMHRGKPYVYLLAIADGIEAPLAWRVSFSTLVDSDGNRYTPGAFTFIATPDAVLSLTRVAPIVGFDAESSDKWAVVLKASQDALSAASRSEAAALAAEESASEASADADVAASSRQAAEKAAGDAQTAKSGADTSRQAADQAASSAQGYASQAQSSATDAANSAALVKTYSGTGSPEGKVTAGVGALYVDSTVTWRKVSGTGSTGWRVENGDTGWRNVSGQVESSAITVGSGGFFQVRRIGAYVEYALKNITFVSSAPYANVWASPSGFNVEAGREASAPLMSPGEFHITQYWARIEKISSGTVVAPYRAVTTRFLANTAWPTSLPGTPA